MSTATTWPAGLPGGATRGDRQLGPAAGGGAEIDDPLAGRQQVEPLVQLHQLEGGARAEARGGEPR